MMYRNCFKRVFDFILSGLALIVLSPVLLTVALLVRIKHGSPVLFKQKRIGKDEKEFYINKFRSMSNKRDEKGILLPDSERLTPFGRFIRSTSLDELPELLNILKGDMAIVGPRPLVDIYLPYYTEEERKRHCVRPGLTGLAQVHGRNATTWEERFAYDVKYVNHITLWGDLKIILDTVLVVFRRDGIGERGVDSLPDFHEYRKGQSRQG